MPTAVKPETQKEAKERERQEAVAYLRDCFPPGSTVYTVLRRVSRSGMMRHISVVAPGESVGGLDIQDVTWAVARALAIPFDRDTGGVKVGGCGMDMGFHLAYELSHRLCQNGFECIGQGCPSNDHSNGDREYTPHQHQDGGYMLRHRWL